MFASNSSQVSSDAVYVEDVFSTYLYTGNASTQNIVNGIDLAGKGGMVWGKTRNSTTRHVLFDTARGVLNEISSNLTDAQTNHAASLTAFNSNGYTLGNDDWTNYSTTFNSVSWTFRKQPKFFDIVTYTGNGSSPRTISHNLGSTPGCIIVKCTSDVRDWVVWHRTQTNKGSLLDTTEAFSSTYAHLGGTVTSTTFSLNSTNPIVNGNGQTYVAYLFAHDAGGFGLAGTDSVISCGSYTGNGSTTGPVVNLGWEPQWLLIKDATTAGTGWNIYDNMRGIATGGSDALLLANSTAVEASNAWIDLNATGFQPTTSNQNVNSSGDTYIYIAIRRGPMKTPTSGTSVFSPAAATGSGSAATITGGPTPTDFVMYLARDAGHSPMFLDRLRGSPFLNPASTSAESSPSNLYWDVMNGYRTDSNYGNYATSDVREFFKRAPGFVDVVCYTGTGSATTVAHNLGVVPELIIEKRRNASAGWNVYTAATGTGKNIDLQYNYAAYTVSGIWNSVSATNFGIGTDSTINASGGTYVAYLFASCPGVSKVGSYTGTGTTLQINCGFTGGARFVLIKRTDSTGDWYVWDTARGIISGNDPYILLNSTAAEVTSTDYIDAYSAGFEISSTAPAAINASGGTFIYLAIS